MPPGQVNACRLPGNGGALREGAPAGAIRGAISSPPAAATPAKPGREARPRSPGIRRRPTARTAWPIWPATFGSGWPTPPDPAVNIARRAAAPGCTAPSSPVLTTTASGASRTIARTSSAFACALFCPQWGNSPTILRRRTTMADLAQLNIDFGPLQELVDDDTVSEILVNGPDQVYVER